MIVISILCIFKTSIHLIAREALSMPCRDKIKSPNLKQKGQYLLWFSIGLLNNGTLFTVIVVVWCAQNGQSNHQCIVSFSFNMMSQDQNDIRLSAYQFYAAYKVWYVINYNGSEF